MHASNGPTIRGATSFHPCTRVAIYIGVYKVVHRYYMREITWRYCRHWWTVFFFFSAIILHVNGRPTIFDFVPFTMGTVRVYENGTRAFKPFVKVRIRERGISLIISRTKWERIPYIRYICTGAYYYSQERFRRAVLCEKVQEVNSSRKCSQKKWGAKIKV